MKFVGSAVPRPVLAVVAVALLMLGGCRPVFLVQGEVSDAASGCAVYGARVSYAGRCARLFTQQGFELRYRGRPQGPLRVTAPGYAPAEIKPQPRRRRAWVKVSLVGTEIPGWRGILVWTSRKDGDLAVDIRLVDAEGAAIEHFPGVTLAARARIWENRGSASGPVRGRLLYEGTPEVTSNPESRLEKLRAVIPAGQIAQTDKGLGVLEFVLQSRQGQFAWTRGDVNLAGLMEVEK